MGVPQHRKRAFVVGVRNRRALRLKEPRVPHKAAKEVIDWSAGSWSPVFKPGRAQATIERWKNGRKTFGDRFLMPFYGSGSGKTGRSLDRPIGTITTAHAHRP